MKYYLAVLFICAVILLCIGLPMRQNDNSAGIQARIKDSNYYLPASAKALAADYTLSLYRDLVNRGSNTDSLLLPLERLTSAFGFKACSRQELQKHKGNKAFLISSSQATSKFKSKLVKYLKNSAGNYSALYKILSVSGQSLSKQDSSIKGCVSPILIPALSASPVGEADLMALSIKALGLEELSCLNKAGFNQAGSIAEPKFYAYSNNIKNFARLLSSKRLQKNLKDRISSLKKGKLNLEYYRLKLDVELLDLFNKSYHILNGAYYFVCNDGSVVEASPTAVAAKPNTPPARSPTPLAAVTHTRIANPSTPALSPTPFATATHTSIATPTIPRTLDPSALTSSNSWQNRGISNQTGSFRISFKAMPLADNIDAVTGFSNGAATSFDSLGPIFRFNSSGFIDARNGSVYAAVDQASYKANKEYNVSMDVHLGSRTYSMKVQNDAGVTFQIANNYAFRTSQSAVSQLSNIGIFAQAGSHTLSSISAPAAINTPTPTPTPRPGACGSVPNGGTGTRTRYLTPSVPAGQTCASEVQTGTCQNGTFINWTGTYTNDNCFTEGVNSCATGFANSITQYGITWSFDRSYPCGRFANEDYWVAPMPGETNGKVRVTSITPDFDGVQNGWEVNPLPYDGGKFSVKQGYSARTWGSVIFDRGLIPNLPYNAAPGQSIVKALGNPDPNVQWECVRGANGIRGFYSLNRICEDGAPLKTAAVLTVVGGAVPEGTFRPPYSSNWKPLTFKYNSNVSRTKLLSLNPVPGMRSLAVVERMVQRLQLDDGGDGWNYTQIMPTQSYPGGYGADVVGGYAEAILRLQMNDSFEAKERLLKYMIQIGIDYYGLLQAGRTYPPDGGHFAKAKLAIVFAGYMLGNNDMLNVGTLRPRSTFQEDCNWFYANENPAYQEYKHSCYPAIAEKYRTAGGYARFGSRACGGYRNGNPDEMGETLSCVSGDNRTYWTTNLGSQRGNAIALEILGLKSVWGNNAFFDHMHWTWGQGIASNSRYIVPFNDSMYGQYHR